VEELDRVYEAALGAIRRGEPAALATVIETRGSTPRKAGAKMLVYADGRTVGTVGGGSSEVCVIEEALDALADGIPREVVFELGKGGVEADTCGGDARVLVEVLLARPALLIVGAGHIGQALAELGAFLGYRIAVLDERAEMVTADRFPQADVLLAGELGEQVRAFPITAQTHVVFVTPHHSRDEEGLAALGDSPVPYVGLLGSRRRTHATFERARALGVPDELLARVHTPVGLDIGAETPREIAVSIIAELIAVRRGTPPEPPGEHASGQA
jgi:xanthine dehydrogenase accessory factor